MDKYMFQESMRVVYCMNDEDFKEVFGDDGHLFRKYRDKYNRDIAKFIISLDVINLTALFNHVKRKVSNEKTK